MRDFMQFDHVGDAAGTSQLHNKFLALPGGLYTNRGADSGAPAATAAFGGGRAVGGGSRFSDATAVDSNDTRLG